MNWSRARRHTTGFLIPFGLAVVLLVFGGDIGKVFQRAEVTVWCSMAAFTLFAVAMTHPLRVLLLPYADLKMAWNKLLETSVGAGLGFLGGSIIFASILFALSSSARANEPPQASAPLLPILVQEQTEFWPGMADPALLAGQVEQETGPCPGRQCWSPRAELKTPREQGLGLGQFTRTARFDAVSEIRLAHPVALKDYVWDSPGVYDPRLQLRALVLRMAAEVRQFSLANPGEDHAMALAAYNGGRGSVVKRVLLCRATSGCDPNRWFGHLEKHPPQAKVAVHGYGESFAEINSRYPGRVFAHAVKYREWIRRFRG